MWNARERLVLLQITNCGQCLRLPCGGQLNCAAIGFNK